MSVSTGPVPEQAQLVALSLRGAFRRVLEQLLPYYVHQSHCTPESRPTESTMRKQNVYMWLGAKGESEKQRTEKARH